MATQIDHAVNGRRSAQDLAARLVEGAPATVDLRYGLEVIVEGAGQPVVRAQTASGRPCTSDDVVELLALTGHDALPRLS